jgi:hypothetical protein
MRSSIVHALVFTTLVTLTACKPKQQVDLSVGVPADRATVIVLSDQKGIAHRPLQVEPGEVNVLIFTTTDCPIANAYAPEIGRLIKAYDPARVHFFLVHVDRTLTREAAMKHAADFSYECPVLIDRDHALVRAVGATITPEAVVMGPANHIVYQGRISDLYPEIGQRRFEATKHDLREAIDAALAGREPRNPRTQAVGCAIPGWVDSR